MAKHEIKLRERSIDSTTLERHRDYSQLLKQHRRSTRIRRTKQFFLYTFLVAVVVVLLLLVISYVMVQLEKNREEQKDVKTSMVLPIISEKNISLFCDYPPTGGLLV